MRTVVDSEPIMWAASDERLIAVATDLIHPDGSMALSKSCIAQCMNSIATAQLSAHHSSIRNAPGIVTDGAPVSLMEDLHSASATVTRADQPHWRWS